MMKIVSNAQMREMDNSAINNFGIPGIVLMENAGRNTAESILEICEQLGIYRACILCGKGNNGGDGFVIARYLFKAGLDVDVFLAAQTKDIKGDARVNLDICRNSGIEIIEINSADQIKDVKENSIIIDALLGTGVKGEIKGTYADLIHWINQQDAFVCSVDVPSGISGDDAFSNFAVEADVTFTMGVPKLSQFFYPARTFTGDLEIIDIGFPDKLEHQFQSKIHAVYEDDIVFPDPDPVLYKHSAGKVFILGGSPGLTGAVVLASKGASLAGAGLVYAGVASSLNPVIENKLTEQMSLPLPEKKQGILDIIALDTVKEKIDWSDTLLIGPGMGRNEESFELFETAISYAVQTEKIVIIDADGLYFLSKANNILQMLNENCILTPHHGEFLRFDPEVAEKLKHQPWEALQNFSNKSMFVTNLKGAPSMVCQKQQGVYINTTGNPGLAKGGSGDLLGGMIAGMTSAGMDPVNACISANFIHGKAADNALEKFGMRAFSLDDLVNEIKIVFKDF